MGFWINNFVEFERKQNRENRLVLNFRYVGDENKEQFSTKVFVKHKVKVPTGFMNKQTTKKVKDFLLKDNDLSSFEESKKGMFSVISLEIPYNKKILTKLPKQFQTGNYDKLLRFGGFYPDRKVALTENMDKLFRENKELELDNLSEINFGNFLSLDELKSLPYIIIDIEKPLWKKDFEKKYLKFRDKLLKEEKRYSKLSAKEKEKGIYFSEKRKNIISRLEKKLTIDVENVGKVELYDKKFKSDISFVGTIWGNGDNIIKEMYVIDPNKEIRQDFYRDFKVLKFEDEKGLVVGLLDNLHKRKPLISYGHNQVYDITQLRFAAEDHKIIYDPSIKGVKPKRDFVVSFIQRLREDLIYLDTLWMSKILYPYLNQKRFNTNHKLASVAKHLDIDFVKSQSHEDLRFCELERLFGNTEEVRGEGREKSLFYSCGDLDVSQAIVNKMNVFPLIENMKRILPFCTYSEISFSTNSMNKLHEFNHFQNSGNNLYYKYKSKERQDELQIFKKRFPSIKKKLLTWAGLKKIKAGEYSNVQQFYFPFEEIIKDVSFKINPILEEAYMNTKNNPEHHLGFLQYLKAFSRDILVDYYFVRRNEKIYNNLRDSKFSYKDIESKLNKDSLDRLKGSFRYLKNNFRSIYVVLDSNSRKLIRTTKSNISGLNFPLGMKPDLDLFLLKENSDKVRNNLSKANKRKLLSFMKNFDTFQESLRLNGKSLSGDYEKLLYTYIYYDSFNKSSRKFFARYKVSTDDVKNRIGKVYLNLASEIKKRNLVYLDNLGDYIFVSGENNLDCAVKIRDLESFIVK